MSVYNLNIKNILVEAYLPFGYKDNKDFGANPYTAKLDRDAIRKIIVDMFYLIQLKM